MDLGIKGKVAVVTAASKGLGRAVAMQLAAEGAKVAVCARHVDELNASAEEIGRAGDSDVVAYPADVTSAEELDTFFDIVTENLGPVDILVANAGGPPPGRFESLSDEQWQAAIELNLMSSVRLARHVLPGMLERKWGRILFMTSVSVKQPLANLLLSNSIRAAVTGMAKTLADEVAGSGVLVNCLLPGFILTGRMEAVVKAQAEAAGVDFETRLKQLETQIPVGRLGRPEEFANMAAFLVSERASYVTGTSVLCDGGLYRGLL
jgi:3-oxoacyl-[acyl-carrier protein] reductase